MNNTCVLFCVCGGDIISSEKSDLILNELKKLKIDLIQVHDFCGIVLNRKEIIKSINLKYENKIIIACYPRAILNLLSQNGLELNQLDVINFRELECNSIIELLKSKHRIEEGEQLLSVIESLLDVPAWYPVIDEKECTNCGKCFKFCLFGVYTFNDNKLKVVKPLGCKNNCPACGRNCPTNAIIFPRLKENSVLSGANISDSEKLIVAAHSPDIMATLNRRADLRRSIFRPGIKDQAEKERQAALNESIKKEA